jgi:hypothetical protein
MPRKSNLLGGDRAPEHVTGRTSSIVGPSDSSDSGSDIQGAREMSPEEFESDSDAAGTGERGTALGSDDADEGADIAPDRIETEAELAALDADPGDLAPEEDDLPEAGPVDADFRDLVEEGEAADEDEEDDEEEDEEEDGDEQADAGRTVHRR